MPEKDDSLVNIEYALSFGYMVCATRNNGGITVKCAGGILIKDNKILLGKRSGNRAFYPDVWDIIGGHCRDNEPPEHALSRELQEEIGVTPVDFIRIAVLHGPGDEEYEYTIYVVTEWTGSPENMAPEEHSALAWVAIDEALTLHLAHPGYYELFKDIRTLIEG